MELHQTLHAEDCAPKKNMHFTVVQTGKKGVKKCTSTIFLFAQWKNDHFFCLYSGKSGQNRYFFLFTQWKMIDFSVCTVVNGSGGVLRGGQGGVGGVKKGGCETIDFCEQRKHPMFYRTKNRVFSGFPGYPRGKC